MAARRTPSRNDHPDAFQRGRMGERNFHPSIHPGRITEFEGRVDQDRSPQRSARGQLRGQQADGDGVEQAEGGSPIPERKHVPGLHRQADQDRDQEAQPRPAGGAGDPRRHHAAQQQFLADAEGRRRHERGECLRNRSQRPEDHPGQEQDGGGAGGQQQRGGVAPRESGGRPVVKRPEHPSQRNRRQEQPDDGRPHGLFRERQAGESPAQHVAGGGEQAAGDGMQRFPPFPFAGG